MTTNNDNGSPSVQVDERLRHIAFIMDGNGRWAKKRGMPREYGHKAGAEVFKKILRHCVAIGIPNVTVYAFSSENWKRPAREVNALMRLFSDYLKESLTGVYEDDVRVKMLGERDAMPQELVRLMDEAEEKSASRHNLLNLAVNYGGRQEIVSAVNRLIAAGYTRITEADISANLYNADCPPPDLIVRCGGEIRTSNFLMWESAYSEWYFCDTLWPDMTEHDVDMAVEEFYRRSRRFGGV